MKPTGEIFSEKRIQKCMTIQRLIMDNFQKSRIFSYTIRATEPGESATIDEMRKRYFAIGLKHNLSEIPFLDFMVVLSLIEQEYAVMLAVQKNPRKNFTVDYVIKTDWSDDDAMRLLLQAPIEVFQYPGKRFQVLANPAKPDDLQTQ